MIFFFKLKTAYEMRISDWRSVVCSSDLLRDMALASLRSLSAVDKREPALKLFADVVGKPTFPADSFARIKNQLLAGFEYQKQNPGKLAGLELMKRLYGDHPYAHSSDGNAQSIPAITLAQARKRQRPELQ